MVTVVGRCADRPVPAVFSCTTSCEPTGLPACPMLRRGKSRRPARDRAGCLVTRGATAPDSSWTVRCTAPTTGSPARAAKTPAFTCIDRPPHIRGWTIEPSFEGSSSPPAGRARDIRQQPSQPFAALIDRNPIRNVFVRCQMIRSRRLRRGCRRSRRHHGRMLRPRRSPRTKLVSRCSEALQRSAAIGPLGPWSEWLRRFTRTAR